MTPEARAKKLTREWALEEETKENRAILEKSIAEAIKAAVEEEKVKGKERARDFETAFRVVRKENDKLREEIEQLRGKDNG